MSQARTQGAYKNLRTSPFYKGRIAPQMFLRRCSWVFCQGYCNQHLAELN
ncbi:hypothetical protein OIU79_004263, partial [Salix purpurea]